MKNVKHQSFNRSLPALLVVGGSLAALPAAAVELGELTVHSRLGNPLRASIAIALAPNESINSSCVSLAPPANGWPGIGRAAVRVRDGALVVTGDQVMREPMVSTRLVVNCPYAANISREYMLFIDPPTYSAPQAAEANTAASRAVTAPVAATAVAAPVTQAPAAQRVRTATPTPPADIPMSDRYRVQPGDSASRIVERIDGRTMRLWPAVNAIVNANPHAFIDGDPNLLKAGVWLDVPAAIGGAVSDAAIVDSPAAAMPTSEPVSDNISLAEPVNIDSAADAPVEMTGDLQAEDVVVSDNPFVEPATASETIIIPDTQLEGPITTSTSPNVTTAVAVPKADADTDSINWMYWLGGAGMIAIFGLLFFGRRLRNEPAPFVPEEPSHPMRRASDTEEIEALVVYDIDDDSPTEENLALDADLVTGTGLQDGTDVDVNQDFGFAATAVVDVELPFEPVASMGTEETDMLPSPTTDSSSILDSEVMPVDDDYDMSVMIDATKMPQHEEVTERDLKAVELPDATDSAVTDSYTVSRDIDYEILEQDYEDEMTATQALNKEIARAAAELAETVEKEGPAAADETGVTAVLPMASVTELDVTAEMPAANADEAVELESTVEMPTSDSDDEDEETANMQVESGKLG